MSEDIKGLVKRIKNTGQRYIEKLLTTGVIEAGATAWYLGNDNEDDEFKATEDGRFEFIGTAKARFHDLAEADRTEATLRRVHSGDDRVTVHRLNGGDTIAVTVTITVE